MTLDGVRLSRLACLTDQLWTGGALPARPDAAATVIDVWRQLGIRAVVDTRAEWSDKELVAELAPEIAYINPGVVDGGQRMRDEWFEEIAMFAIERQTAGASVLVHCSSGINRGPSGAFAVLLATGWDPVDAIELIVAARPVAIVSYAENALEWWSRSANVLEPERESARLRFDGWRRADREDPRSGRSSSILTTI